MYINILPILFKIAKNISSLLVLSYHVMMFHVNTKKPGAVTNTGRNVAQFRFFP